MFITCQIGAREHYAIPRALHAQGALAGLFTDFWVPPDHAFGRMPGARRLMDRWHPDLAGAKVHALNVRMLAFEMKQRLAKRHGWDVILARNRFFQLCALRKLPRITDHGSPITLFSYSYAALDLFRYAKSRGWRTVLGQIDPGPEEERIVAAERSRYPSLSSSWQPAPAEYWRLWREEIVLSDEIIINSEWSRQCLLKEGVPAQKMRIVPLVYGGKATDKKPGKAVSESPTVSLLFLGQINLRKGVGRLLDAMRLLQDTPVGLTLAGPSEIDPSAWADLPNVRWVGPVPRSEVGRYYVEADCFILPTLSDGYALTQLEALSHGLPVIASRHCGEAVIHGRNGWILDDLEPNSIAAAIRHAITKPLDSTQEPAAEFGLKDLAAALLGNQL